MKITRKEFLNVAAGAAAIAAIPTSGLLAASSAQPASTGKPKRGTSIFVYQGLMNWNMTMEDVFQEMNAYGSTGFELLTGYIPNYPNPTDEWVEWWWSMMDKYNIIPIEYGHWVDSRLDVIHTGRELGTKESYDMLVRDIKLANKLGFPMGRTKLGVIDRPGTSGYDSLTPVKNWQEFIKMALPVAEEYNFVMQPEIHSPTLLNSKMVAEYVDFIQKNNTKWFGLNIDFGVFQNKPAPVQPGQQPREVRQFSKPEEIVPLLPYVHCCHAKFVDVSEDCQDTTTPYEEVINLMIKNKWDGYLLSEYEGQNKNVMGYPNEQVRRQHVMLKRLLGEV